jgi:hypothetical protein
MLFDEIVAVHTDNYMKAKNSVGKHTVADYYITCYVQTPLGNRSLDDGSADKFLPAYTARHPRRQ